MIVTLLIVLRRWTRSRCRDPSATLHVTSAMGVRVVLLTGTRAQGALHAACVLQQGAPCTPQIAGIVTILFVLACSAGGRDCEEFPAASRGVAQLQVGRPAARCRLDGQPWQLLAFSAGERSVSQPARAAGAAPPMVWRRSCTTGRRSTRRCGCRALMAGPLASEAPTASAALQAQRNQNPACHAAGMPSWHALSPP